MERVLPREVQKLASVIKEKDAALNQRDNQIEALEFTNEGHQQENLRLNEEIDEIAAKRHVARRGCFDNMLCFIKKNNEEAHPYYVIQC